MGTVLHKAGYRPWWLYGSSTDKGCTPPLRLQLECLIQNELLIILWDFSFSRAHSTCVLPYLLLDSNGKSAFLQLMCGS